MMKTLCMFLLGGIFPLLTLAQAGGWKLKKDVDDLRVYCRKAAGSGIQEIKVKFTVDASLTNVIAVINDVAASPEWVYACAEARIVKRLSPTEMVYYGRVEFPLTMSDRDFVVKSKLRQNPKTKEVFITSTQVSGYVPAVDKCVRVPKLVNKWRIKPLSAEQVYIEYEMATDPGGSIPDWLINMAIDKGPIQSIKGLKEMLQKPEYRNAKLAYIKEVSVSKVVSDDGGR